jgi:hypothetical protein
MANETENTSSSFDLEAILGGIDKIATTGRNVYDTVKGNNTSQSNINAQQNATAPSVANINAWLTPAVLLAGAGVIISLIMLLRR